MKKIIFILLITFPMFLIGQTHTSNIDSAGVVGSAVDMGSGNYPTGIEVSQGLTDSLYFMVSIDNGTNYRILTNAGATYYVLVDSSIVSCITLSKDIFYPWGHLKPCSVDAAQEAETVKFTQWRREK